MRAFATSMRWLLVKDLQILARSPLLVGLLVVYPIVVAVLIGMTVSRGPDKPKVAIVNELAPGNDAFVVGGRSFGVGQFAEQLFEAVDPIAVATRAAAIEKVRSGEVLGALIVPADATRRLQDVLALAGTDPPTLEAIYNGSDPLAGRLAESTIDARLAEANRALSEQLTGLTAGYLRVLLEGGDFSLLGRDFDVLGLVRSEQLLRATLASLPPGSEDAQRVERVAQFARRAIDNLDLSSNVLAAVGEPIHVERTVLEGRRTPLDAFAIAVAAAVSAMLIAVLLGAGMLALEREEHAYARLVRGLVTPTALLVQKALLAALCAAASSLLLVLGVSAFAPLRWDRAGAWIAALMVSAAGFAALGVALGSLARDLRAASLLALLIVLPLAFLALLPAGAVGTGVYDAARAVSALFPFRPALYALDAALNGGRGLPAALAHLAALVVAYLALARLAVRRFAT